jgi:hypothetical protein
MGTKGESAAKQVREPGHTNSSKREIEIGLIANSVVENA